MPSAFGAVYLVITFLSFIFSLSFGHSLTYLYSISMLIFFVFSAFIANGHVKNVSVIFRDDKFFIFQKSQKSFDFKANKEFIDLKLRTQSQSIAIVNGHLNLKFSNWGRIKTKDLEVTSSFPFFLFRAWKYLQINSDLYILPAIDSSQMQKDIEAGPTLKAFAQGDKLSRINWKKSQEDKIFINYEENNSTEIQGYGEITLNIDLVRNLTNRQEIKDILVKLNSSRINNVRIKNLENEILTNQDLDNLNIQLLEKVEYED